MTESKCNTCKYWTPPDDYDRNAPDVEKTWHPGICWRFPQWELTQEHHHCGEYKPKP